MSKKALIFILGQTASGKSSLAVRLAKDFAGEVISADSRQVYKGMDIGTGKVTQKEMQGISHHLLDVASPKRRFTVSQYRKLALEAIRKIFRKDKLPIICGGTAFYIQALLDGLTMPEIAPDWELRKKLSKKPVKELYLILKKLDPRRAKNIDRNNPRRLIRAIEIVKKTGKPVPVLSKDPLPYPSLIIGVRKPQKELSKLIKKRLLKRMKAGMTDEVKKLKNPPAGGGLSWKRLDDFGLEYRWISRFLQKQISYKEMLEFLQKDIEHFSKRQMTWFKKDERIHWVKNYREAERLTKKFVKI